MLRTLRAARKRHRFPATRRAQRVARRARNRYGGGAAAAHINITATYAARRRGAIITHAGAYSTQPPFTRKEPAMEHQLLRAFLRRQREDIIYHSEIYTHIIDIDHHH